MNSANLQQRETVSQLSWTALIVLFFAIQGVIWTVAITVTSQDPSHAVVEGYDQQALNWDEVKRQRLASDALGWSVSLTVSPTGDIRGNRIVTITIAHQNRTPIQDAVVVVNAFHRGRAAEVQSLQAQPMKPGVYTSSLLVRDSGIWRFKGTATVGGKQLLFEQQILVDSNRNL